MKVAIVATLPLLFSCGDGSAPEATDSGILDAASTRDGGGADAAVDAAIADANTTDAMPPACVQGAAVAIDGGNYMLAKNALQLVASAPNLSSTGFQSFNALTCGLAVERIRVNIFQTGVVNLANGWDEEHELPVVLEVPSTTLEPEHSKAELAITHVDTLGELGIGTTLFNTSEDGDLTFAVRVYDSTGLVDCLAFGHDVPAMFAGQVPANNAPGPPTNLSEISSLNCTSL